MLLRQVFERFVKESPVSVMVRGLLEKALCPQTLVLPFIYPVSLNRSCKIQALTIPVRVQVT